MSRRIQRRSIPDSGINLPEQLHPVLRRIYAARGVQDGTELEYGAQGLLPASPLMSMDVAVELLDKAIEEAWRIVIVGDFDADGATSTAVAVKGLTALGAHSVEYVVPNRFAYGYGLSPEIVAVAAESNPDLIITVDNGIASHDGVEAARARGIRVLVTDHHLPGERLPAADAIVNPNQPGDPFPSKHLAGVGVMFYVLLALRARRREKGQGNGPNLAELLDLVALGTVADVVKLDRNNRILVEQGLRRIRAGHCRPGIAALIQVSGRNREALAASDLGFAIGPRLNAAGRLEDMGVGIECLLTGNPDTALMLAGQLDELNRDRRAIEQRMQDEANRAMDALRLFDGKSLPWGLVLHDPAWHQGVVGILASRLKDRFHRPVIALAPADQGDPKGEWKGSARAIPGLHVRDVLEAVDTRYPGLMTRYGGHAMAAGMSMPVASLDVFTRAFDEEVRRVVEPSALEGVIVSDGELERQHIGVELAEAIRAGGPWGQGFPEPVFDGVFRLRSRRVVGERHLKLEIILGDGPAAIDGIAFNYPVDDGIPPENARVQLAYRLDVNEFRGVRNAQMVIEELTVVG
ncbi:MAG: single-stranded-DNA-specific exonuclease RecJ [Gammaproteobacteria bacterium]|nr:single-stranded-DNA-specific exonuclease RecJ [Gammaproteobacteria bacterium]MCP5135537.1 single-stranded-DNA-specific exonuclease RecJ [Gammaproteobacteria bacterium]